MNNKKCFRDRKDGKRIDMDGMHYILADFKPDRCDADVYINQTFDVTNLIKFVEKKKKDNPDLTKRMIYDGHTIGNHTYKHSL